MAFVLCNIIYYYMLCDITIYDQAYTLYKTIINVYIIQDGVTTGCETNCYKIGSEMKYI